MQNTRPYDFFSHKSVITGKILNSTQERAEAALWARAFHPGLILCYHTELERAPGQQLLPAQPFPALWICKYRYSRTQSSSSHAPPHLPSDWEKKILAGPGQVLTSLFLLPGFVLESILGVMGRKIELALFKGFANEFIHERLQGLSFPSNTSRGFANRYSPMAFTTKAQLLLSYCFKHLFTHLSHAMLPELQTIFLFN